MILSAQSIRARCGNMLGFGPTAVPNIPMITPFNDRTVFEGMSYGLSGAGYDVRIDQNISIAPGDTVLASIMEHLDMPRDLLAQVADKSTWARQFLTVQNTIIEPGWRGWLTVELINHSPLIIDIKRGMPIAQLIFMQLDEPTEQPYSGKYQDQQRGPQKAKREIPADEPVLDASWYDDNVVPSTEPEKAALEKFLHNPISPVTYRSNFISPEDFAREYLQTPNNEPEQDFYGDEPIEVNELNIRTFQSDPPYTPPVRHTVRQENDEYACSCGKRWDVSEGEEHP